MINELSDSELETYSRQIVLADIGYDGQVKLRNAKVCIVGIGGLGSPTALKLTGMGVGYLRIVDRDIVSRSDLHRQYLYDSESVGQPKVEVAFRKLSKLNPDVKLDPIPESLNAGNAEDIIQGMDVVIDGLDRPEPRYIINRICNKLKTPYIFGAAIESRGNMSTLVPGQTFCLECFMSGLKDEDLPACGVVGVHPSVLGVVSSIQVSEAVRLLIGRKPKLLNKLFIIDLKEYEFNMLSISALEMCRVCGTKTTEPPENVVDKFYEETCARDGRRNFILSPKQRIEIDLQQLEKILNQKKYKIRSISRLGITFEPSPELTACFLKSGIMNAQSPPKLEGDIKNQIFKVYKSLLVGGLGFSTRMVPDENE